MARSDVIALKVLSCLTISHDGDSSLLDARPVPEDLADVALVLDRDELVGRVRESFSETIRTSYAQDPLDVYRCENIEGRRRRR